MALYSSGESKINDLTYRDKFDYVYQLNKYQAKIKIFEGNKDFEKCEIYIKGPVKLNCEKINIDSYSSGPALFLAALGSDLDVDIINYSKLDFVFENLVEKVVKLGADVKHD